MNTTTTTTTTTTATTTTTTTDSTTAGDAGAATLRVLVTKIGFDGHDRGSRLVAAFLRDAGHEVVYTPPWQQIPDVVNLALQEDVDVIGISSLATDHLIVPDLMEALSEAGLEHVAVVVGGIVPEPEMPALLDAGVRQVFGPGSSREQIVDAVATWGGEARRHKLARGGFDA